MDNNRMKLAIEVVVNGVKAATDALTGIGKAAKDGLADGMAQAVKEASRPLADLEKLAKDARETLKIRPHIEIAGDIASVRKAYDDLKSSGTASMVELAQAKLKMKERVIELKSETNGWVEVLGKAKLSFATLVGAGAGIGASVGASISFETAMSEVRKTTDASGPALEALGKTIKRMSAEIPVAQNALAEMAAMGGQLGVPIEQLDGFIRLTAKTSVAFGISAGEAADAVGKLQNIFKASLPDVASLGDSINALGNKMAATERDILSVLTRTGGIANQFGLSAKATSALAATLLSLGDAPEIAGTAINNMLTKLQSANVQGGKFKEALAGMGLSANKLASDIKANPQAALNDFLSALEKLDTQARTETLGQLFGAGYDTASIAKLASSLKLYQDAVGTAQGAQSAGALDKEFAARLETTQSSLDKAGNAFRNLAIAIGDVFAPAVGKVADLVNGAAEGLAKFAEDHPFITGAVAGLGTLAASMTALSLGWSALALGAAKFATALSAHPVLMTIFAGGAVGWAFGTWLNDQINIAVNALTGGKNKNLGGLLYDLIEGPRGLVTLPRRMKEQVKEWVSIGAQMMDGLWQGIQASIRKPLEAIGDLAKKLPEWAKDLLGIHSPSRVFMEIGHDIGAGMVIGIADSEDAVRDAAKGLANVAVYAADDATRAMILEQERAIAEMSSAEPPVGAVKNPKQQRNKDIAKRYQSGESINDLAREYGLSAQWVKEIVKVTGDAEKGFSRLGDTAERVANGMAEAIGKFVETGKLDFKSLTNSIIADLVRISIQENITKPLSGIFSDGLKSGGGIGGWFSSLFANANGGVYSSPSLSAYSNQIVDKPTFFAFANGGVMGEAGPEAIMPLKRGPDGTLGVRGGGSNVVVNVINTANGTQATQQTRSDGNGGKIIDVLIEQVKGAIAGDIARGSGPVSGALAATYGLNRVAGAY